MWWEKCKSAIWMICMKKTGGLETEIKWISEKKISFFVCEINVFIFFFENKKDLFDGGRLDFKKIEYKVWKLLEK